MEVKQKLGEHQQAWVDALRSGKYKQGREVLRSTNNKFCCLGVACDVQNPGAWVLVRDIGCYDMKGYKSTLAEDPRTYYGFIDAVGSFRKPVTIEGMSYYSLTGLNDLAELTFNQIADIVEANPENLFKESK